MRLQSFLFLAAFLITPLHSLDAQIVGTASDLLDDNITFSAENLQIKRYVTLPNSFNGNQQTKFIISMTNRPGDDATYVSSQDGKIHRVTPNASGTGTATEWFNVTNSFPINNSNTFHGGLRGIAFHPDFNDQSQAGYGKFYGSFVTDVNSNQNTPFLGSSSGSAQSVVAEWNFNFGSNSVDASSYRELFRVRNPQLDHPIKQISFNTTSLPTDDDYGLLYIAHGDGSVLGQNGGTGQVLGNALGKILRVDPIDPAGAARYTTPGNTYAADGSSSTLAEIYSAGHRNPHHINFGKDGSGNSFLVTAEVGQDNIDEINVLDINVNQNGESNGFDYGWSDREGTFERIPGTSSSNGGNNGYGVRPASGNTAQGRGDGVRLVPDDDDGNEYIYPSIQLDHNDPTEGNRFGVAGGPVIGARYLFGIFASNGVRPGGPIHSVSVEELLAQQTTFDASSGEDFNDLTWIDDLVQHRLEFDDDNDPLTAPVLYDDFASLLGEVRSDVRFGTTSDGQLLLSSKRNGAIYLVSNAFTTAVPEPSAIAILSIASGMLATRRRRSCR